MRKKEKKKPYKFLIRMRKKLMFLFFGITLVLVSLIGRLMYIEHTGRERYDKIVLAQQLFDSQTIPYQRGDIVDTKGTVLATSIDVYNVILDCWMLNKNKDDISVTLDALAECFSGHTKEELEQILEDNSENRYMVLERQISHDEMQPFLSMREESEEEAKAAEAAAAKRRKEQKKDQKEPEEPETFPRINKDAVWFEKEYIRSYPYNTLAASLIGFVSKQGNLGTSGLENYYNSTLNGINGRQYGYLNSDNNFEKTVRNEQNGNTIVLTIDVNIQSAVEKKLAEFNDKNRNGYTTRDGSLHTAAIVMNPQNGEVYAMANYPTFDLNNPRDIQAYFTPEELAGLTEEQQSELLTKRWENFCVTYTFEPGSTVKPLTVACGLETGTLTGDESYYCDGVETFNGEEVHCVSRVGHGMETVEQSLMDSCNDALMQMSYAIGADHFMDYQDIFGFGQKTGIDLPGEEKGLIQTEMKPIDLATNVFGQNFNCTMIQLASAFSSLINGGRYFQPHVVRKILDENGNTIETVKPVLLKETVSEHTSDIVREYLYATVSEGTGSEAKVNGYSMGGKTGTAQKLPRGNDNYLVSFIGYVPQENPQLVIYVIIDEPNKEEQAHSNYAQEVTKEILKEILPYMNMYPDEELKPEEEDDDAPEDGSMDPDQTAGGAPEVSPEGPGQE